MSLKNIVQQLREERKLLQRDLAEKLDVSRQTIISIENGRYNPSLELAFKLSKIFERPIEKIFVYEEDLI